MKNFINISNISRVFLLGGNDLEMTVISELLTRDEKSLVIDKNLTWGASTSKYSEELSFLGLNQDIKIYGIELEEDSVLPSNYIRIDHHGDLDPMNTSLLQVLNILGEVPNRYMELVSANDHGYIPGMLAIDASKEEIDSIRLNDRSCQGISAHDEELGKHAVENMTIINETHVVHSYTGRFATITDRLFPCNSLLIHTDNEWCYYGKNKNMLKDVCNGTLKTYDGGGDNGYVGGDLSPKTLDFLLGKLL